MPDDVGKVLPQGTRAPATVPAHIFAAAVDAFVTGQRLDMRSLAKRIGVARATLYRRAGNREQLLDQVLWWRARRMLADQVREASRHPHGPRGGPAHRVIADRAPDIGRAITVIEALLRGLDLVNRAPVPS